MSAKLTAKTYAAAEIDRVKAAVSTSFEGHVLGGLSDDAVKYISDLLEFAFDRGVTEGEVRHMVDINTRYTLRPRLTDLDSTTKE